jgi:hypothetical protein
MFLRLVIATVMVTLLLSAAAAASEFDGWTLRQIRHHKDFHRDLTSMSSAFNTANKGGKRVYHWIGYIPSGDKRVYFTSFGEPLTAVKWEKTGEWVPEWALPALDKLTDEGYIKLNTTSTSAPETTTVGGNG